MMHSLKTNVDRLAVLFTCIGRRVSLLNSFRRAAQQLKVNALFLGTDTTELSPALQSCDKGFLVRPVTHADYINQLLRIVKTNRVRLLVPTVDLDLKTQCNGYLPGQEKDLSFSA
jgi:carbamoyl-phosphate synthase large subunit